MVETSENTTESGFKGYPEIENHYNKIIQKYINEESTDDLWVATEKVHGTNFCFNYDGKDLVCSKRTSYLAPKDKFFGF
jgi:hypothetical protein